MFPLSLSNSVGEKISKSLFYLDLPKGASCTKRSIDLFEDSPSLQKCHFFIQKAFLPFCSWGPIDKCVLWIPPSGINFWKSHCAKTTYTHQLFDSDTTSSTCESFFISSFQEMLLRNCPMIKVKLVCFCCKKLCTSKLTRLKTMFPK